MKELIVSTVLQNGVVGQSHLSNNQRIRSHFRKDQMTALALAATAAPGGNCMRLSPTAAPTGQEQPPHSRQLLTARSRYLPVAKPTQAFSEGPGQTSGGRRRHWPRLTLSGFGLLGDFLFLVLPRGSQRLFFSCAVCLHADPVLQH